MKSEAKEIIDLYFSVLDHGFIALKDVMGSDQDIEEAARVSYGHGTRKKSETRGLLRYLLRHKHTTPFEMVELKFHCAMPIFVARQWIRHRTANVNEYSGRYSLMPMLFYKPDPEQLCKQSKTNKQGRDREVLDDQFYNEYCHDLYNLRDNAQQHYEHLTNSGVARELARIDLPLSMYTYWYWKIDLHNLFHFLNLRCDSHAQWEIRQFANVMAGMVKRVAPLAFEAWVDYTFCSSNWTRLDKCFLDYLIDNANIEEGFVPDMENYEPYNKTAKNIGMSDREITEFWQKLKVPKVPNFDLDLSKAKSYEYFEKLVEKVS